MGRSCRNAFKILTDIPVGKRLLGIPVLRREDNIRIDHKEIGINMRIGILGEPL